MRAADLKKVIETSPFRPFAIRLNDGAQYTFASEKDFGATKQYNKIFHLGERSAARIDVDSIVEIIESN